MAYGNGRINGRLQFHEDSKDEICSGIADFVNERRITCSAFQRVPKYNGGDGGAFLEEQGPEDEKDEEEEAVVVVRGPRSSRDFGVIRGFPFTWDQINDLLGYRRGSNRGGENGKINQKKKGRQRRRNNNNNNNQRGNKRGRNRRRNINYVRRSATR